MPFQDIVQPEVIPLSDTVRLKKYDGHYEKALAGYQDPYVYQNSEGIFDETQKPDLDYVRGMFRYLDNAGELYFIEALEGGEWVSIGDVTAKPENPPIAIWFEGYRGKGIGRLALEAVIARLRELGYDRITGSAVYKWNEVSLSMHRSLGFQVMGESETEVILALEL